MADDPVRALVHRPAVDVLPDTPLRAVAATLDAESVGVVIVRAAARAGAGLHAAGLVSERDIVRAIADGADADTTRAEDVMTEELEAVTPDASIREVAERMLADEIRHVPVVDDGAVVGVVSMRDVFAGLLGAAPAATTPVR
jgi:CBS domain-containing protein